MPRLRPEYANKESTLLEPVKLFVALKAVYRDGYGKKEFKRDGLAGLVVGLVAIPLGMALAIAVGVAPQAGLYTVIFGGFTVALMGGSRCQVSGPTAAFVVILVPIVEKFGLTGLLTAGLLAGLILICMGWAKMGQWIQYIPHPVTTGFTAGIGLVIATLQIKDFFGLKVANLPEHWFDKVKTLVMAAGTFQPAELLVGATTLGILIFWPRKNKAIPAPLVALGFVTVAVAVAKYFFPQVQIATVASKYGNIPSSLPAFRLPWILHHSGSVEDVSFPLTYNTLRAIGPSAFSIALLGAIESLLSAVVADGMAQTKHDPDAELVALGIGNTICPFFGGIPATGAIARTATNIRYGGRSPVAAMVHAVFALLVIICFAPYISQMPMAGLSALLLLVAYNMSDVGHFFHILKVAPRSDIIVLLICFGLTVVMDMVAGVTVGVMLAALLMMRRVTLMASGQIVPSLESSTIDAVRFPEHAIIYRVEGPLLFGAAEKAITTLEQVSSKARAVIFDLGSVPMMDVTGLVALETAVQKLNHRAIRVVFLKTRPQVRELLEKSGLCASGNNLVALSDEQALLHIENPIKTTD